MSINSVPSTASLQPYKTIQQPPSATRSDEGTESSATRAKEAVRQPPSQPVNANLGKTLNITA